MEERIELLVGGVVLRADYPEEVEARERIDRIRGELADCAYTLKRIFNDGKHDKGRAIATMDKLAEVYTIAKQAIMIPFATTKLNT